MIFFFCIALKAWVLYDKKVLFMIYCTHLGIELVIYSYRMALTAKSEVRPRTLMEFIMLYKGSWNSMNQLVKTIKTNAM